MSDCTAKITFNRGNMFHLDGPHCGTGGALARGTACRRRLKPRQADPAVAGGLLLATKEKRDAAVHSGSRLRSHPLPVLTKLSPFTQRSPMGSMVIESAAAICGLSAPAIAAFLASSTVSKSPVYVASKAGGMPGARGLAK